ncbi:hypothetical protein GCM10027055_11720 [Janibacter alkaliphilus]|uniref:Lipopolysaccharide biosynthesis glycosyltransferase n=1 Tax=Janibacter alkaliphilus TaxID=1069963 RepID=A0A852XH22_9MICO|nr:lipopolysaccharide biosynthesis glycosyltransferase [Janibacter alkaliphilus]
MPDDLRRALDDAAASTRARARKPVVQAATKLPPVRRLRDRLRRAERDRDAATRQRDQARAQRDELRARVEELRAEQELLTEERDELRRSADRSTERARGLGYAYRGLRAAALGVRPSSLGGAPGRVSEQDRATHEAEVAALARRGLLVSGLADGEGLEGAVAGYVRAATGIEAGTEARRVSQWLYDHEPTRRAGALGTGLVAHRMGLPELAWERLSQLPVEVWLPHAASEYVMSAGRFDPEACERGIREALDHEDEHTSRTWLDLLRRAMGLRMGHVCEELAGRFDAAAARELDGVTLDEASRTTLQADREWVARWAPRVAAGEPEPLPGGEGVVPIAVMGYDQPDRRNTSSNIGDYVQTVASLGHLVRHTGARFDDTELGRFAAGLAERVPAARRVEGPPRQVSLHQVDRDAASYSAVPDGTWLLAFGWYAHKLGGIAHDLPWPDRLRPLYVSFHVSKRDLLTTEMVEHLRAHAPIGCRDWSTVDVLLGLGVPAFFSGCLTTTVTQLRPDGTPERPADAPTLWVDAPAPRGARRVHNERPDVVTAGLLANLREAVEVLDTYAAEVGEVVTRRLHAYLPARALGCRVDFSPTNPSDVRFAGLSPLTDDEVAAMGDGIADLLEPVMTAILAQRPEDEVRALWSERTEPLVQAAQARSAAEVPLREVVDIDAAVATVQAGRVDVPASEPGPDGEPIEVVVALDGNLKEQMLVVVDGMVEHATRPIHLTVLSRDHDADDHARVARLFPTVSVTWLPCDGVDHGEVLGMIPHITVSTMDRLLLPELLADVDRVVYHDIDALPVGDVAELYATDLQGLPLAARDSEASTMRSGYTNIFVPASLPGLDPGMGAELIRRECARHPFDFVGLNAGILVLDLDRMRADRFCQRFLPYASSFGMHDQHILNVYVGGDRVSLAPRWNARPSQETVTDPAIIHWAGTQKPWDAGYVHHQDIWRRQVERVRSREAALTGDLG